MGNITKAQFVENVRRFTGLTSNAAADILASQVIEALVFSAGQGTLVIRSFGTFRTVLRKAKMARNPQTGEAVPVPARERLTFKPSSALRKD